MRGIASARVARRAQNSSTSVLSTNARRRGRALLPAEPERRSGGALDGEIEVRARRHDDGVLPAHLADRRARPGRRERTVDRHPHLARPGERQPADASIGDERGTSRLAGPGDEVDHAGRDAGLDQHVVEQVGAQRADLRWLEHDRVPGDQRRAGRPGDERHGVVERADHRPHAERAHHVGRRLGRHEALHRPGEPLVLAHRVGVVADQVGRLLDVAERFEAGLADLPRHAGGELGAALRDQIGGTVEERHPLGPRRGCPLRPTPPPRRPPRRRRPWAWRRRTHRSRPRGRPAKPSRTRPRPPGARTRCAADDARRRRTWRRRGRRRRRRGDRRRRR